MAAANPHTPQDAHAAHDPRPHILFLCTGNSCRSQMAEGWARALLDASIVASSAGTNPHGLNPLAVRAMREAGIDISAHTSKQMSALPKPDVVVTVCDSARESCPVVPGIRAIHAGFDDPPRLAAAATTDDDAMPHYRRVRDEIRAFVETLPRLLNLTQEPAMPDRCCEPGCCSTSSAAKPAASAISAAPAVGDVFNPSLDDVRDLVRQGYGQIARSGCCGGSGGCCGPSADPEELASVIGYTASELATTPAGANMGLSCGNPTAIASLRPGEVVLDLGAGGGFDCFIAGPKVGAAGRVIGVDMTADMLAKARRNTAIYRERTGLDNVEFRLGEIESLPVADASVDVVISNCVLNLSPDKPRVWREIARVLRPGGRVAVSDLALLRPLPDAVRADVDSLIGCVAGAVLAEDSRAMALAAGLSEVTLTSKAHYIDAMMSSGDPLYRRIVDRLAPGTKPSDYITSLDIAAVKP